MKLCKDCRHVKLSELKPAEYSDCLYTFPGKVELVTGMPKSQPFTKCAVLRGAKLDGCCGPEAIFFEPKDPIANCVENAMRDLLTDAVRQ